MVGKKPPISSGPRIPKAPKPKAKGKKKGPKKFKVNPDVKKLDVFKVVMHSNAGGGSSHSTAQMFKLYLSYMSRAELKKIDKKIRKQYRDLVKEYGRSHEDVERGYRHFKKTMENYLERSRQQELYIEERVEEVLEKLDIEEVVLTDKDRIQQVVISGETYSINRFIKTFLGKELELVEKMLDQGKIIKKYKHQTPRRFIKIALEKVFD